MQLTPHSKLVGSLNWLATSTRPDIAHSVGTLCRFISNPGRQHWTAAQRVLKYLAGTPAHGLRFERQATQENPTLIGYSDSDWAGDPDTRRSTTGHLFLLHNSPVSWKSKPQPSTALSSVEFEYIALCSAAREATWIRQVLTELYFSQHSPTKIFDDNKGCLSVSSNNRTDSHIDVKYHYVRQLIRSNQISVEYVPTKDMIADILTKPTFTPTFKRLSSKVITSLDIGLRGHVEI